MLLLIVLLPFTGYLWSIANHHPFVYLLAFVCLVLVICIESINQLTAREARAMQLRLMADTGDLDEWKEKVSELDRIVAKISDENAEYRHQALDKSVHAAGDTAKET